MQEFIKKRQEKVSGRMQITDAKPRFYYNILKIACPKKVTEAGEWSGEQVLWGTAEGTGVV